MSWPGIVLCAYVAAVSIPLVVIDVREHRLPNRLVVPGMGLALLCGVLEVVLTSGRGWMPLLAGVVAFAVFALLSRIGGLGMGDVKLAAVLGVASGFLGGEAALSSFALAFVLGGIAALGLWLFKRRGSLAFGPFLLLGFWASTTIALTRLGS